MSGLGHRAGFVMSAACRVYPKQQTFPDPVGTSHLCQKPTSLLIVTFRAADAGKHRPQFVRERAALLTRFLELREDLIHVESRRLRGIDRNR